MNWTKEQEQGFTHSGENILLAAAAGSGKTAVLSERVLQKIIIENINIENLLVLTFTDKTANEMRAKIGEKLNQALFENPNNEHLRRQTLHINRANISTIHSFCLEVIKNNIHLTNLPANFSVGGQNECDILKSDALTETLNKAFVRLPNCPEISAFFDSYGNGKDDRDIRKLILEFHSFSRNLPNPNKWLVEALQPYKNTAKNGKLDENLLKQYREMILFYLSQNEELLTIFNKLPSESLSEIIAAVNSMKKPKVMPKTKHKELYKLTSFDAGEYVEHVAKTAPALTALVKLTILFDKRYRKRKLEKKLLDFDDFQHEMLKLLIQKGERTQLAKQLSERYAEILIDEYQDINELQNEIFVAISRDDRNIFMVGDIKQSIYQFRGANPILFLERYHNYKRDSGNGKLIKLYKNFRSRDTVIDFVNFIFHNVMSATVGDVDYTHDEELIIGADYPAVDNDSLKTEIYLISNDVGADDTDDLSKIDAEAIFAAKRIREIIDNRELLITDKTSGELRPANYRDFAILSPTVNGGIAKTIEEKLFELNIPAYGDVGESYLTSWEIMTILSFLQIIDNPLQDIPLIAVLLSQMFRLSPEALAEIRLCNRRKNIPFYMAMEQSASEGNEHARDFICKLERLRELSIELGVDQLIWYIYQEFGFYDYVGTLTGGESMQANLRLLFERAGEFEQSRLKGLFSFNHYIVTLIQEGRDFSPAKAVSENENVVRIMSIHKSKGLEFPIVIILNSGKKFYTNDITHPKILWNSDVGIGAYYIDPNRRIQYSSITRDIVAFAKQRNMLSEEMRKLYVALTRAKEKLIIIGTPDRHFDNRQKKVQFTPDGKLPPLYTAAAKSFLDWIVPSVKMTENPFVNMVEVDMKDIFTQTTSSGFACHFSAEGNYSVLDVTKPFIYPYSHLHKIPVKLSVSEIKRQQMPEDDTPTQYFRYTPPGLGYATEELSGIERGTIAHFVMQHLNERAIKSIDDVETQLNKMIFDGKITPEQAETIDINVIFRFFQSDLGIRLSNAKTIEKEVKFYMKVPAAEILPELSHLVHSGEEILVQGVVDCYFIEETTDGKRLVIIDYKTDKVNEQSVIQRSKEYKTAIEYYARGLGEILEMEVDEKYLYFFETNMLINVDKL